MGGEDEMAAICLRYKKTRQFSALSQAKFSYSEFVCSQGQVRLRLLRRRVDVFCA